MNDKVLKNLDIIYAAIGGNNKIIFEYVKWTPERKLVPMRKGQTYSASPFAITLNDDNYYLIAYDDKYRNIRHYRIDKMQAINISPAAREGREYYKQFNIAEYKQKTFGMFSGKEESVKLQCNNSIAGVIIDRFGESAAIRPDFDNPKVFIARVTVNISPQFYAWLFALGTDVKILSPESVIHDFSAMTDSVLKQYRN